MEHVRELVVDEGLDVDELVADLPSWASGDTRADGEPVIVDVSLTDPNDIGERTDAILEALEDRGIEIDWDELDECQSTVSQEMVEESEGPYRGPVHPDDD